ncbi:hypothetical protein DAPPUDRAFT_233047 [Daphnia pulex]|uniref:Uncharacterized protein n=1 Tax=Daphnia pulex TaxID=6669 RepID=E9FT17_DAPPU|nr:hypothetical protein DAPPUDRAFT_233047 [Daphnia pulex]|eukprot:EFX89723.1 hypothetical protein DAPPUDRAFT_233047 [Daphnia pulex]
MEIWIGVWSRINLNVRLHFNIHWPPPPGDTQTVSRVAVAWLEQSPEKDLPIEFYFDFADKIYSHPAPTQTGPCGWTTRKHKTTTTTTVRGIPVPRPFARNNGPGGQ